MTAAILSVPKTVRCAEKAAPPVLAGIRSRFLNYLSGFWGGKLVQTADPQATDQRVVESAPARNPSPTASRRHRFARPAIRLGEISVVLTFLILAAAPYLATPTRKNYDYGSYLHLSLYRLPVVPLVFQALTNNFTAIVIFQTVVGVACWAYLAFMALEITRRPASYLAASAMVFAGCTDYVTHWYASLLSDSLSISLLALLLGSLASWLLRRGSLVRLVIVALVWAGTRDTNGYLILLVGVVSLLYLLVRNRRLRLLAASALLVTGGALVVWDAAAGGIWEQPFQHVLTERILPRPSRLAWFRAHGMPVNATLLRISGSWTLHSEATLLKSPNLAEFRHWMSTSGEHTYLLFAATHPLWALEGTFGPQQQFDETTIAWYGGTPTHQYIPLVVRNQFLVDEQGLIFLATALAGLLTLGRARMVIRSRRPLAWWWGVLALGYLGLIVVWVGDSWEVGRHSIDATLEIWIASAFITALVLGLRGPSHLRPAKVPRLASSRPPADESSA